MAPQHKKRKSAPCTKIDSMNSKEFMEHVRNEAKKELQKKSTRDVDDLDHLLKTTRAILTTNKEIWERCEGSMCLDSKKPGLQFKRIGFTHVDVVTLDAALYFQTTAELHMKEFSRPSSLPHELTDIISPVLEPDGGVFPDYDSFLKRSLLLDDDILVPFIAKFKEHLEMIQVYLGKIDAWVMEPSSCRAFLDETFVGIKLAIPDEEGCMSHFNDGYMYGQTSCSIQHPGTSHCFECHSPFQNHSDHICATGNMYGSFLIASPQTLMSRETAGDHKHTFDISNSAGQERLKAFIAFVSCD